MPGTKEAGRRVAPRTGFPIVAWTADDRENSLSLSERQAAIVARRRRLSLDHARIVVALAFGRAA